MKKFNPGFKLEWKKYIAELLVVFVGVTSAFLLNDWAQKRNSEELENKYITSLLDDLKNDSDNLKKTINYSQNNFDSLSYLNYLLSKNFSDTDTLLELSVKLLNFEYFYPSDVTFETMKSSGGLNIIGGFEIRRKIIKLYSQYEGTILFDDMIKKYTDGYSIPYFINNTDLRNISGTDLKFYYDKQFSNILLGYLNILRQKVSALKKAKLECDSLRTELELYIK